MSTPKIKIGEMFEIVEPSLFVRCGYPLTPGIIYDELNTPENRQRMIDLLHEFGLSPLDHSYEWPIRTDHSDIIKSMLKCVSYHSVRNQGFGGCERKIYTKSVPELKGKTFTVKEKKRVCTGIRNSGSGWVGIDDYEGPYLSNAKHHNILGFWVDCTKEPTYEAWISQDNVVKITPPYTQ